jgi:RimJ/RimL family protein N-acetyltransferase
MAKETVKPFEKNRIRLRLLEEADLAMTLAWRNQSHIRRWFVHSDAVTPAQHENWFKQYLDREDDFVFIIEEVGQLSKPVGQVSLYKIDKSKRTAEFGRLMVGDPEAKGKGIAKLATSMVLEFGFSCLDLELIYLEVFKDNHPAIHIYLSVGFVSVSEKDNLLAMQIRKENLRIC